MGTVEGRGLVENISRYTQTFLWLQRYDEGLLDDPDGHTGGVLPEPDIAMQALVYQMEIVGTEQRIPDAILNVNGLPLMVFEIKSAIREEATIYKAYEQLTKRYVRDIPELMKYNALCVISDGIHIPQV